MKVLPYFLITLIWLFAGHFQPANAQKELFEGLNTANSGIPTNHIFDIVETSSSELLLATPKGILHFDGREFRLVPMKMPITGFFNHEGLWHAYGTLGQLFEYQGNLSWKKHPASEAIQRQVGFKLINQMNSYNGSVHLTTVVGGGLYKIAKNGKVEQIALSKNPDFQFFMFAPQKNKPFLCGSYGSNEKLQKLVVMDGQQTMEIKLSSTSVQSRSRGIRLRNGGYLYAKGNELIHFTSEQIIARQFVEFSIQDVLEDSEGRIWLALEQGGLMCFPSGQISNIEKIRYLNNTAVECLFQAPNKTLWIGSAGKGLISVKRQRLKRNQPSINVTDTLGVENRKVLVESSSTKKDSVSTKSEAVDLSTTNVGPEVFITSVQINGIDTSVSESYNFGNDVRLLEVSFGGFLANQGNIQYKYRLIGYDEEWVYTGQNSVQFTALSPGKFLFEVYAASKEGVWSATPANISFSIATPWYSNTRYQVVIGAVLFVLISFVFFLVSRYLRQKEKRKAAIQKRLADLELQSLRSQMNPHFIFNTLSSIQHFITGNKTEDALRYLSKFAKLMRTILDNSKSKVVSLREELQALTLYLDLEKLRFKGKFDYEFHLDKNIEPEFDDVPPLIMQPYVENAIIHGIMPLKTKGKIDVWISREQGYLRIVIEDNGVGRNAAKHLKTQKSNKSLGMNITRNRLDIINKLNHSDLSVNIVDKYDENKQSLGTRVEIFIPSEPN